MNTSLHAEKLPDVVMPVCPIEKSLKGQKALVTGANSGIGKGVAIALGRAGADGVVNYYAGEEAAQEVVDATRRTGSNAYAHPADVSQEEQVHAMFQRMFKAFGTIDLLINNAGIQKDAPFDEMTLEQWNAVMMRET